MMLPSFTVCVTVISIPLMLFGLLGNSLTILVVWLRPHMRSCTYLYVSSMAISDLLILLLLPLDLYKLWRPRPWTLGDLTCKLTIFLSECCTFCTILHITFLSLERYVAICWPITAKTLVTSRRTRAVIGCLWISAAVSAAPVLIMVGVEDVGEDGGLLRAQQRGGIVGGGRGALMDEGVNGTRWSKKELDWTEEGGVPGEKVTGGTLGGWKQEVVEGEGQKKLREDEGGGVEDMRECRCSHYAITSGLMSAMLVLSNLYFLVPVCILTVVYGLIGRTLWLRPRSSRRDQSHRSTVKMLGVIVLAFVLCWLPFHVGRTIFSLFLGAGAERPDTYMETSVEKDLQTHSSSVGMNVNSVMEKTSTYTRPPLDSEDPTQPGKAVCDLCVQGNLSDVTPQGTNSFYPPDTHLYFLYTLSQYFNLVSSILYYLSAAINPLLYNLMSERYRLAARSLLQTRTATQRRRRTFTSTQSTTLV
ncbi:growth hormone secretagogue receptor type 1-like [Synchiropus picturatus]